MNTQDIKIKHAEIFDGLECSIARLDDALNRHVFISGNNQHVVVYVLALRLIELSRACHSLAASGYAAANAAMARSCLEAWFRLMAVIRNPEIWNEYLSQKPLARKKGLEKVLKHQGWNGIFTEEDKIFFEERWQELKAEVERLGCGEKKILDWAKLAGAHEVYLTLYHVLSECSHSGAGSIEYILQRESNGQIFVQTGLSDFLVDRLVPLICELLASSVIGIDGMFGVSGDEN